MPHRLSKSRYTAGIQCHKLLWWKVHEPNAVELQPGKVLQDRFDQGAQVGALARDRFPGGVLVDLPHRAVDQRVKLTRKLIDDGAPAIFEASFLADNTFVAVDVLTPQDDGYHLTEVKSSSSQKEEHLPDAAVQVHVLSRSGIHITGVGRLVESTVWVNGSHPGYRRAVTTHAEPYHVALTVGLTLAPLAAERGTIDEFVTAYLPCWGETSGRTNGPLR